MRRLLFYSGRYGGLGARQEEEEGVNIFTITQRLISPRIHSPQRVGELPGGRLKSKIRDCSRWNAGRGGRTTMVFPRKRDARLRKVSYGAVV